VQQLTGIDASFLNLETSTTYGHVASMTVFDRRHLPPGEPFEIIRRTISERLHLLAPFRRRLVEVPFGLDLPYWIEDPEFDLDFHVRHHGVPPPGDDPSSSSEVVSPHRGPPTRPHPPAVGAVRHRGSRRRSHGDADQGPPRHDRRRGSGAQMLMVLLDTEPDVRHGPPSDQWVPEPIPTDNELLQRTMREFLRRPEKLIRLNVRMLREMAAQRNNGVFAAMADMVAQPMPGPVGQLIRNRLRESAGSDVDHPTALPPTPAPKTPWNRTISAHRRFAFTSIPLEEAKAVRRAFGCTFNDVVMAVCSGALRRYLERHEALPPEPLIAMVPVSIRTGGESDSYSNRVSGCCATSPPTSPTPCTGWR
jgi:diacylglycerol O-acyltransferase